MNKVTMSSGYTYEVKHHALSERKIDTNYGKGEVIGIRAKAKSAQESYAFIVLLTGDYTCLMSRGSFRLIG